MRIAVIGAGNWGRNLVRNLSDMDVLSHVVEQKADYLKEISSQFSEVECLDSFDSLLESNIDAVAIATQAR